MRRTTKFSSQVLAMAHDLKATWTSTQTRDHNSSMIGVISYNGSNGLWPLKVNQGNWGRKGILSPWNASLGGCSNRCSTLSP